MEILTNELYNKGDQGNYWNSKTKKCLHLIVIKIIEKQVNVMNQLVQHVKEINIRNMNYLDNVH